MFKIPLSEDATLSPLEPWQAEDFYANIERCREHITPWVGPGFVAKDLDNARHILQRYADGHAADGKRMFGIRVDGKLVGGVMYVAFDAGQGVCELGCWLEPSAEGRGLVTKAIRVLLEYAFDERGFSRAEWWTRPTNEPSIKVAKRLGMTLEGTLRSVSKAPEGRRDFQIWSLLAEEWAASRG